jgi:GNAT superfamily N-acetyltransferase
MALSIRRVTREEETAAVRLIIAQFREHAVTLSNERVASAVRGLLAAPERGALLLARGSRGPVGIAALAYTWTLEHGGPVAWLDELYVVPEKRGRGVGRALLDRACAEAAANGCLAIELEVDRDHARAEALYERAGFARLPRFRWARALPDRQVRTAR